MSRVVENCAHNNNCTLGELIVLFDVACRPQDVVEEKNKATAAGAESFTTQRALSSPSGTRYFFMHMFVPCTHWSVFFYPYLSLQGHGVMARIV